MRGLRKNVETGKFPPIRIRVLINKPGKVNPNLNYLPLFPNVAMEKSSKLRSLGVIRRSGVYKICIGVAGTSY